MNGTITRRKEKKQNTNESLPVVVCDKINRAHTLFLGLNMIQRKF